MGKIIESEENARIIHEDKGITIAEIEALYFDKDAIVDNPEKVYRVMDNGGARYYCTFDRKLFKPSYFIAVTAFTAATMPTPQHLIKWYAEHGWQRANEIKQERADYGTLMHIEFNRFLISGSCDLDGIEERARQYISEQQLKDFLLSSWIEELKKDVLGLAQFCIDYRVKSIAMGIMLVSRELGTGGVLDWVVTMDDCKYTEATPESKRKRVNAIIDFKGGKSGFYETNEVQLHAYNRMWRENFPNKPIHKVCNFSGSDWRKAPSYKFEDHTTKPSAQKLEHLLAIAKIDNLQPKRTVKSIFGNIELGQPVDKNYEVFELDYLITQKLMNV